jgi:hypothetical protein
MTTNNQQQKENVQLLKTKNKRAWIAIYNQNEKYE